MTSKLKTDVLETVSGSGTIALTNQLSGMTSASVPAGSVLQVINFRSTGFNTATTSTSYVDTGVEAAITPSSTSSKILIVANLNGLYKSGSNNVVSTRLLRGSTDLSKIDSMNTYTDSNAPSAAGASISYLDSPSSSSAITYKVQFASANGATAQINVRWNSSYTTHSFITLTEIKG